MVADRTGSARCDEGFIRVRRYDLVNVADGGDRSAPYTYDVVERRHLDAVAVALHDSSRPEPRVMLRVAFRPPLFFRPDQVLPLAEERRTHAIELPAGLIEDHESGPQGIAACAARETQEETGLTVSPAAFHLLGPPVLLSPGLLAEKVHFLEAEVDLASAQSPAPEGPVEEAGGTLILTLVDALQKLRTGEIDDAKTEIGLRRLATLLAV